MNSISSRPSSHADLSANQQQERTRETQQDQVKQAEETKKNSEAQLQKSSTESLQMNTQPTSIDHDFLNLVESISKDIYQAPQAAPAGKGGENDAGGMNSKQNASTQSQKDMQVMKEFLREANYLIKNQNMDVAQMLNTIRVEQGGVFWSKIQEVLQKGIPWTQTVVFQNVDKSFQEISKQFMGMEWKGNVGSPALEQGEAQPGKALLEIIKAESNPQGAMEHYMSALQILMKDGFQVSAQKLISYLRRRSGLSEPSQQAYHWADLLRKDVVAYQSQKEEKSFSNFWYLLIALGTSGAFISMGFDWIASLLVGISLAVVIFIFSLVFKK